MCRLFAIHSSDLAQVHHPLVEEANALRQQSREHPHGWGIAFYSDGTPQVARGLTPAHEDENFVRCSREVSSATVLAHVRKASVGQLTLENTHPFRFGPWVMAHNGTVPDFETVRERLESLIAPAYREQVRGETDSERIFAVVLSALARRGDPLSGIIALEDVLESVEEAVRSVMDACLGLVKQPSLNLVMTNGRILAAFRHGRSLFYSTSNRLDGASIPIASGDQVQQLAISSERIGPHEGWQEVPEDEFIAVDETMHLWRGVLNGPLPGTSRQVA
jgi:glutamine amidotransferase